MTGADAFDAAKMARHMVAHTIVGAGVLLSAATDVAARGAGLTTREL